MLAHEAGHCLGAIYSGGVVQRVVWHPAALSRTEVSPNPNRLVEVWAGPIAGSIGPVVLAAAASLLLRRISYLVWVSAGLALIVNGVYIGLGAVYRVGDAKELAGCGVSEFVMGLFAAALALPGMYIWDRVSPRLGCGDHPAPINPTHAWVTFAVAIAATVAGWLLGDAGG